MLKLNVGDRIILSRWITKPEVWRVVGELKTVYKLSRKNKSGWSHMSIKKNSVGPEVVSYPDVRVLNIHRKSEFISDFFNSEPNYSGWVKPVLNLSWETVAKVYRALRLDIKEKAELKANERN